MASSQPPLAPPAAKAAAQNAPASQPAPPVAPHVQPPVPRTAPPAVLTAKTPADHFVPRDPPQATTGVRQHPPANHQQSVAADGTMQQAQPLDWQPFNTKGR